MKQYNETQVKLVSALKDDASSSSLAAPVVKTEQVKNVFVMNVKGTFPGEYEEKVPTSASASMSSPSFPLSRYVQAT